MAQQDILRKYLDILNDPAPAESKEELLALEELSAPSENPVGDLLEAIAKFKATQPDLAQDNKLDPKTLARIMSLGKINETEMGGAPQPPMSGGAPQPPMSGGAPGAPSTTPAPPMEENLMDTLRKKAALHRGYSHGLMGDSHTHCSHKEGTPEHMHWHHGYSEGLKECNGIWSPVGHM